MTTDVMSPREQAEAFVTERMATERSEHEKQLADALRLEKEVTKEFDAADSVYWELARKDLDAEPTEEEAKAAQTRETLMRRLQQISLAITSHRDKLAKLDDAYEVDRRVREKVEQLERGRKNNDNGKEGTKVAKTTRVPVPDALLDRIVKMVETKSQQDVADILNKEGKTTASGKPWTPQNIWHAVKKRTGNGVPRKKAARKTSGAKSSAARKNGSSRKTTARSNGGKRQANPLSKSAQAAGTSRGGSGSRKKTSSSRKVGGARRK